MKFSTRQDVDAPIDYVFRAVTDFDGFERRGLRRGAEIQREDPGGVPGLGTTWVIRAKLRGKHRNITSQITRFDGPNGMSIESRSGGLQTELTVELMALSAQRTRVQVGFELTASSLTGRLVVQSIKLAKSTLTPRFAKRVADFAREIDERYAALRA